MNVAHEPSAIPSVLDAAPTPERVRRVALAQIGPTLAHLERNVELHLRQVEAARQAGAEVVIFPELSLTGYFIRDMVPDLALTRTAPQLRDLLDAAGPMGVVAGFVEESPQHRFYNAAFWGEGGQITHVHRKVYLPTYGLFDEQRYFAAGDRFVAFPTARFGRVGILICEDLWHISAAAIMQAEEVDMLICMANSPTRGVDGEVPRITQTYQTIASAFAQLLGCVVVLVNRVGFEDGLCFWGGSLVVGPDGRLLGQAPLWDEALEIVAFDPLDLRRQRIVSPLARDERLLVTVEEFNRIKRQRYES